MQEKNTVFIGHLFLNRKNKSAEKAVKNNDVKFSLPKLNFNFSCLNMFRGAGAAI